MLKNTQGCGLTSISFNEDGHLLATRAMDDTVKLWDIRKLGRGVVKTFSNVPTHLVSDSECDLSSLYSLIELYPGIDLARSLTHSDYPPGALDMVCTWYCSERVIAHAVVNVSLLVG